MKIFRGLLIGLGFLTILCFFHALSLLGWADETQQYRIVLSSHKINEVFISPNFATDKTVFALTEDYPAYQYPASNLPKEKLLCRSKDGGVTWETIRWSVKDKNIYKNSMDMIPYDMTFMPDGSLLLAGQFRDSNKYFICVSKDDGDNWETYEEENQYFKQTIALYNMEVAGDKLLGVFDTGMAVSVDCGRTWGNIILPHVLTKNGALAVLDKNTFFVITRSGDFWARDDISGKWRDTGTRLYGTVSQKGKVVAAHENPGDSIVVGCNPGTTAGVYVSKDRGEIWNKCDESVLGRVVNITAAPGGFIFAVTPENSVLVTDNYGTTWGTLAKKIYGEITNIECATSGDSIVVFVVGSDNLYRMEYQKSKPNQNPVPATTDAATIVKFIVGRNIYTVGERTNGMDATPYIENGRTYVPVRYLGNALGAETKWEEETKKVTLYKGSIEVNLIINSNDIIINGQSKEIDVAAVERNGRTYLPARYVAEAFGYQVMWDEESQTVSISK